MVVRQSSQVRFYLRRHVQAVEGDKTVSLLVNVKTAEAPAEPHGLPPTCLGTRGHSATRARGQREAPGTYMRRRPPGTKTLDRAPLILTATPRSGTPILQVGPQLRAHADNYSMSDCHLKNQLESTLHLFMD